MQKRKNDINKQTKCYHCRQHKAFAENKTKKTLKGQFLLCPNFLNPLVACTQCSQKE